MIIPVVRYDETLVLDVPETDKEFGGVPLSMIGRINLGPFAEGVQATQPDPKRKEEKRKTQHVAAELF